MLDNPLPVYGLLYEDKHNAHPISGSWIYISDIDNPQGSASGQTSSRSAKYQIDIQNICDSGNYIVVSHNDNVYKMLKVITGGPPLRMDLYNNINVVGNIAIDTYSTTDGDEINTYIDLDQYSTKCYIRTFYGD